MEIDLSWLSLVQPRPRTGEHINSILRVKFERLDLEGHNTSDSAAIPYGKQFRDYDTLDEILTHWHLNPYCYQPRSFEPRGGFCGSLKTVFSNYGMTNMLNTQARLEGYDNRSYNKVMFEDDFFAHDEELLGAEQLAIVFDKIGQE